MSGNSPRRRPPEAARASGQQPGSASSSEPSDLIEVGRVIDAYGIRGWVKLVPFNDPQDSVLRTARRWWLPDGSCLAIERARVHGASIVAHPAGFDGRDPAERLRGSVVRVSRCDFPKSSGDEYYWVDLVGCQVVNPAGELLGTVDRVEDHGAHPILCVQAADAPELMIPFVPVWILDVDISARKIVADWQADY